MSELGISWCLAARRDCFSVMQHRRDSTWPSCGQAIDVLDETGARVRLRESSILPEEAKEAQNKLKEVMTSKELLIASVHVRAVS